MFVIKLYRVWDIPNPNVVELAMGRMYKYRSRLTRAEANLR